MVYFYVMSDELKRYLRLYWDCSLVNLLTHSLYSVCSTKGRRQTPIIFQTCNYAPDICTYYLYRVNEQQNIRTRIQSGLHGYTLKKLIN